MEPKQQRPWNTTTELAGLWITVISLKFKSGLKDVDFSTDPAIIKTKVVSSLSYQPGWRIAEFVTGNFTIRQEWFLASSGSLDLKTMLSIPYSHLGSHIFYKISFGRSSVFIFFRKKLTTVAGEATEWTSVTEKLKLWLS